MSLALLRQRIADIAPPPAVDADALSSGIDSLDRVLPNGGIPRGRLTEVLGPRGSGKTTIVRRVVATARAKGVWVAWIDATRTLAPRDWTSLTTDGFWIVRPPEPARAQWCADVLLRSGAFGLVVLDGAPRLSRSVAVRLTRLARDADAAFIALGDTHGASLLPGALRLSARRRRRGRRADRRMSPGLIPAPGDHPSPPPSTIVVTVEKGGAGRAVEVACAVRMASRLCAHSEVPDRRGVGRARGRSNPNGTGAGSELAAGAGAPILSRGHPPVGGGQSIAGIDRGSGRGADPDLQRRTLPRKRRCAEPTLGRARASLPPTIGEGCARQRSASRVTR